MLFLSIFIAYAVFSVLLLVVTLHIRRNPFSLLATLQPLSYLPFQLFMLIVLAVLTVGLPSIFSGASFIRSANILPLIGEVPFGFDAMGLLFGFVFFTTALLFVGRHGRHGRGRDGGVHGGVVQVGTLSVSLAPLMLLTFSGMLLFFSLSVYFFALGVLFLLFSFVWRSVVDSVVVVWLLGMLFPLLSVSALFLVGDAIGSPSFMFQSSSVLVEASLGLLVSQYVYLFGSVVFLVSVLFVATLHSVVFLGSTLFVYKVLQLLLVVFVFIRFAILLPYSSLSLLLFALVVFLYLCYLLVIGLSRTGGNLLILISILSLSLFTSVLYSYDYKYFALILFGSGILSFIFVGVFFRTRLFSQWHTLLILPAVLYLTRFLPSSWHLLGSMVCVFWSSVLVLLIFFPFTYALVSVAMGLFDTVSYVLVALWLLFYVTVSVVGIRFVQLHIFSARVVNSPDTGSTGSTPSTPSTGSTPSTPSTPNTSNTSSTGNRVRVSAESVFWWFLLPWAVLFSSFFITDQYFHGIFSYVELGSYLDSSISFSNVVSSLQQAFSATIVISFAMPILVFLLSKNKFEQD